MCTSPPILTFDAVIKYPTSLIDGRSDRDEQMIGTYLKRCSCRYQSIHPVVTGSLQRREQFNHSPALLTNQSCPTASRNHLRRRTWRSSLLLAALIPATAVACSQEPGHAFPLQDPEWGPSSLQVICGLSRAQPFDDLHLRCNEGSGVVAGYVGVEEWVDVGTHNGPRQRRARTWLSCQMLRGSVVVQGPAVTG